MDIRDNSYKRMIDEIPIKEELVSLIGSQVLQYKKEEARIQEAKKRWRRILNRMVLVFSILIVVVSILTLVISSMGFVSPGRVVIRYIDALEYPQIYDPKQYIIEGYDISQDISDSKKTRDFNVNKGIIDPKNKNICTVVAKIRFLKAIDTETSWFAMAEFEISYTLIKIDGKWYISEREKGPDKFLNED